MKVKLQNCTPNPESSLVEIARASSSREDKTEEPYKLIKFLIDHRHWSPFEHSFMTVEIITSKIVSIQFLRHRSFYFQEFSQRYAKVEEIEPIELREQAIKNRQSSTTDIGNMDVQGRSLNQVVDSHIETTKSLYNMLIENGVAKECARSILPMATQTKLYMTGNIRSWIHFLELRDDPHAQLEAQLAAKEIKKIFIQQFPLTAKAKGWS